MTINSYAAIIYLSNGNTVAERQTGVIISALTTSAANNVTVIQAAINDVNSSGGGTVFISAGSYQLTVPSGGAALTLKYGVALLGSAAMLDRTAATPAVLGTILLASGTLAAASQIIVTGTAGAHTTNAHASTVDSIAFDGASLSNLTGFLSTDSSGVEIRRCCFIRFDGTAGTAISVVSSIAPPNGGANNKVLDTKIYQCKTGVFVDGSGSTDGWVVACHIINCVQSIALGSSAGGGGWIINSNHVETASALSPTGHLSLNGPNSIITGNYFDTCGNVPAITLPGSAAQTVIMGNFFKAAQSPAPVSLIKATGVNLKSAIAGNTWSINGASATIKGFVQIASTGAPVNGIIVGNVGDGSGIITAPVIDNTSLRIPPVDSAGDNGEYIEGNKDY